MLEKKGFPTKEQIKSCFPDETLMIKPKAVIECYEKIPCNPCSTSCPFDAIYIGKDINDIPVIDFDKCTGCCICVYSCPGLAIKVVQNNGINAKFKIPYEFIPYPVKDEIWNAIDHEGNIIGKAKIVNVTLGKKQNKTALVEVIVDDAILYDFATIRKKDEKRNKNV